MSAASAGNVTIRPAHADELPLLAEIEIDAFATLAEALGVERDAHALPLDVLRRSLVENLLCVAVDQSERPIAFLAGAAIENTLYVIELDVATEWQRRGIGRALMLQVIHTARMREFEGVTLTTDRHVAFNAPFYRSLGFETLDRAMTPRFLQKKLDEEIGHGMDAERRVALALWFNCAQI
jgi:ribosomal protein S18 acetylase RimI-like enzyme